MRPPPDRANPPARPLPPPGGPRLRPGVWPRLLVWLLWAGCGGDKQPDDAATAVWADTQQAEDLAVSPDSGPAPDAGDVAPIADGGLDVQVDGGSPCAVDCAELPLPKGGCLEARCNPASGACDLHPLPEGSPCDDSKACTVDACNATGQCVSKVNCPEDGPCVEAICDPTGGCGTKNKPGPCDDGDLCTKDDACAFKVCLGTVAVPALDCDDGDPCTEEGCAPAQGCTHAPVAVGTDCDDGDLCTTGDACDAQGGCKGGGAANCDDGDPCTADLCAAGSGKGAGCKHTVEVDGQPCDDGSLCTAKDACLGGKCLGQLIDAAKPSDVCTQLLCDPKTAKITVLHGPDGAACSDGLPCTIGDACVKGQCQGKNLQCNQGQPCQIDYCDPTSGSCATQAKVDGASCDDGDACTSDDACSKGKCAGKPHTQTGQCDDKQACTIDACAPQIGCYHLPVGNLPCDDGDACTQQDSCQSGVCVGLAKSCSDANPCTLDGCAAGTCTHQTFVGPCDDNDACTQAEICSEGSCSGQPRDCDDGNPCTKDGCAKDTGCTHVLLPAGTPCQDGLSCTVDDVCDGGKCKGTDKCVSCASDLHCLPYADPDLCAGTLRCVPSFKGKVCAIDPLTVVQCPPSSDPCIHSACDAKTGKCGLTLKQAGLPCSSADKCVTATFCSAKGVCSGDKLSCDDGEPCTQDSCESALGCTHAPLADGSACALGDAKCWPSASCKAGACQGENVCACATDAECAIYEDGDLCNGLIGCVGAKPGQPGVCAPLPGTAVKCPALEGKPCFANLCAPASGKCQPTPIANGGKCDDGHACTIAETCTDGVCSGTALDCDQGAPCTFYVCDKVFGCGQGPMEQGAKCDDGNPCSVKDSCQGGKCVGSEGDCDDGNPCTIDLCDQAKGGCASLVDDGAKCDDGDPCTTADACFNGGCVAKKLGCDDGDSCTIDTCVGKAGCAHVLVPGKDCDDGEPCTTADACDKAGACVGKPRNCDDGNACSDESCVQGVCVVVALVGKACDDADKCTAGDTCDVAGACVSKPVQCDDGNPCTAVVGSCTPKNGCTIVPADGKSCNDGDLCTIADKCGGGACQGITLLCDDSNPCTVDSCAPDKGCVNATNACSDGNDCTQDTCDAPPPWGKGKGCLHAVIDGFQICKDGSACTHKGVCQGATCAALPMNCDDADPCTVDSCDEAKGCLHLPVASTATACEDGDACTVNHCDGAGKCVGVPLNCDDANPCTQELCDPKKGCVGADLKEGALCDDGCACTKGEKCQAGVCSGGQVICAGCPKGSDAECAIFDDNNKCNGSFECVTSGPCAAVLGAGSGVCSFKPAKVVCDPSGDLPCVKSQCEPMSGFCKPTSTADGSACEDGLPCTAGDVCQGGKCLAGPLADCSKVADACNDALCVADPGAPKGYSCVALPRSGPAVACDADGDGCTASDHCEQGKCVAGKPIDCGGVKGPCQLAACVPTGAGGFTCKLTPMPDKSACEDGQLCTEGDLCQGGKCQAGGAKHSCASLDGPCSTWSCDPKGNGGTGACAATAKNDGGACDADGNGCTVKDVCKQGACVAGAVADCSGKNGPCTLGACKAAGEAYVCVATPRNELSPCEADNDGCTVGDRCESGVCQPGKLKDCSAFSGSGGCVVGTCVSLSAAQGDCKGVPAQAGTPCDADGSGCTSGDACNKDGACMAGPDIDCLAFSGSCAVGKCVPSAASPTDFSCVGTPKADGSACDADGDGCTVGDKCLGGKCVLGAPPDCSAQASGACVIGACKNKGSDAFLCLPTPRDDGSGCDADGDGCTEGDACTGGTCVKGPLQTCAAFASACASSTCKSTGSAGLSCLVNAKESWPLLDPPLACTPTDQPSGCPDHYACAAQTPGATLGQCMPSVTVYCDDGNACTGQDVCVGGKCAPGVPKDCDDDNACTLDLCGAGQCDHKPLAGCSLCIDEGFDDVPQAGQKPGLPATWAADSQAPAWLTFAPSAAHTWAASPYALRATWKGKAPENTAGLVTARLRHRRLYMRPEAPPPVLEFRLAMKVWEQGCSQDVLRVAVNDQTVWQKCDNTAFDKLQGGFEKVSIDLSAWRGAALDISWTVTAAGGDKAMGVIDIDRVRLSGACSAGCLGVDFERHDPDGLLPPDATVLPQPMRLLATTAAYVAWKPTVGVGHSGKGAIRALWSGAPPGGLAQEAAFVLPGLQPSVGAHLRFAARAKTLGNPGCTADVLEVLVGSKVVAQVCSVAPVWQVHDIDLTPFVGQGAALRFQVRTAAGASSAGDVEIDDIAVSGACSYTCFEERFDGALSRWAATSTQGGQLAWKQVADKAQSPPKSVFVGHDATAAAGEQAHLVALAEQGAGFMVPVMGVDYSYALNLHLLAGANGTAEPCGGGPGPPGGQAQGPLLQVSLRRASTPMDLALPAATFAGWDFPAPDHCKPTSGWQVFQGKLAAPGQAADPRGVRLVPALGALVAQPGGQLKAWIDDLVFTCH